MRYNYLFIYKIEHYLRLSQTHINDGEEMHLNEIPIVVEDHEDSEIDEISEFLGNL